MCDRMVDASALVFVAPNSRGVSNAASQAYACTAI